jgi:hypothetical protein
MQLTDKVGRICGTSEIYESIAKVSGGVARFAKVHWHIKEVEEAFVACMNQIRGQVWLT